MMMMITPPEQPPREHTGEHDHNQRIDLQHVELQLSAKDLAFLFSGFATMLAFIGGGFVVFNNEICKPALNLNLQEIKQIQIELQQIKEKLKEKNL
jgi:hypothetical protein